MKLTLGRPSARTLSGMTSDRPEEIGMKALLLQLAIAFFTPFVTALYKTIAAKAAELVPKVAGKLPPETAIQ